MKHQQRTFANAVKAEVDLDALNEKHTITQPANKQKLFPTQIGVWEIEFLVSKWNDRLSWASGRFLRIFLGVSW